MKAFEIKLKDNHQVLIVEGKLIETYAGHLIIYNRSGFMKESLVFTSHNNNVSYVKELDFDSKCSYCGKFECACGASEETRVNAT